MLYQYLGMFGKPLFGQFVRQHDLEKDRLFGVLK
jgi:hypothetical protein